MTVSSPPPTDWDGRTYDRISTPQQEWAQKVMERLPLNGDEKPYPFLQTPVNEIAGAVSPDGRWIAFSSDETGRYELYVTSFPSPGVKRQISSEGASGPQWLRGGGGLVYINGERKLIAVDVDAKGPEFKLGESHVLFGGKPLPALPHDPA